MKRFFLFAFLASLTFHANAQNEPELMGEIQELDFNKLRLVYIDHGLPKLLVQEEEALDIYNMDLSLFKSIQYPEADSNSTGRRYVTRSLFDCDTTNVEYLSTGGDSENPYVRIFREDGSIFFQLEGYSIFGLPTIVEGFEWRFVSDQNGSYTTFSQGISSGEEILLYRFCGQVPQPLARENNGNLITGIMEQESNSGFDTYPNPARDIIRFEYELEGYQKANLQIFNTSGQLMKELMLGTAFDHIRLNVSDLDQGTYIARIVTDDGFELSEKFVKVD